MKFHYIFHFNSSFKAITKKRKEKENHVEYSIFNLLEKTKWCGEELKYS